MFQLSLCYCAPLGSTRTRVQPRAPDADVIPIRNTRTTRDAIIGGADPVNYCAAPAAAVVAVVAVVVATNRCWKPFGASHGISILLVCPGSKAGVAAAATTAAAAAATATAKAVEVAVATAATSIWSTHLARWQQRRLRLPCQHLQRWQQPHRVLQRQ